MAFPSFFIIFIILIVLFQHHLRKNMRLENQAREQFWAKEQKSLIVRRKDFSSTDYILIPKNTLDLSQPPNLDLGEKLYFKQLLKQINALEEQDMMNFSNLTNSEIRLKFGTANQTVISNNELNYNNYLKALAIIAKFFIEYTQDEKAIDILERCIEMNSDYTDHFITLAKLYQKHSQNVKLKQLLLTASNLETPLKKGLLEKLKSFH